MDSTDRVSFNISYFPFFASSMFFFFIEEVLVITRERERERERKWSFLCVSFILSLSAFCVVHSFLWLVSSSQVLCLSHRRASCFRLHCVLRRPFSCPSWLNCLIPQDSSESCLPGVTLFSSMQTVIVDYYRCPRLWLDDGTSSSEQE